MQIDEVRKQVSELLTEIRDIRSENEQQMLKERVSTFTKFQSDSRRDRLQQIKQELEQLAPKNPSLERLELISREKCFGALMFPAPNFLGGRLSRLHPRKLLEPR